MKDTISDPNFPRDGKGRVYHLGVGSGDIANRMLIVGDHHRARRVAQHLDSEPKPAETESHRGFLTFTGKYHGVPITIMAIGMGYPNLDFCVRESRAVVQGDLAMIRFGSCGSLVEDLPVGSLSVCKEAVAVTTNFDYFHATPEEKKDPNFQPYWISKKVACDQEIHDSLAAHLRTAFPAQQHIESGTLHAAADTFYAAQGRRDVSFPDENEALIDRLKEKYPDLRTLEMETYHLFHLASLSTHRSLPASEPPLSTFTSSQNPTSPQSQEPTVSYSTTEGTAHAQRGGKIRAAAVHQVFAGRMVGQFISPDEVQRLENLAGEAALGTLAELKMDVGMLHPEAELPWNRKPE